MKQLLSFFLGTLLVGFSSVVLYELFHDTPEKGLSPVSFQPVSANKYMQNFPNQSTSPQQLNESSSTNATVTVPMADFSTVAETVTPTVVHIKTKTNGSAKSPSPFDFFGGDMEEGSRSTSSGSGVILSQEGYIVTNKHVIEDATKISVTLQDRRSFTASVVGTDKHTDLAVLKINETNLPYINYGNSDVLKVGEWVVAVGNPFNLSSTVTTGIVSAKARKIGISPDQLAIESFIQTDAAVNPGNSGGALVNLRGQLIGVNTAIATPTGYYTGYSFALPVNVVKKVVEDILKFGEVKRGYLGVGIMDVDSEIADAEGFDNASGVFISKVTPNSAADEGGIEMGDVIIEVEQLNINTSAELQEIVSRYRPGDMLNIKLKRDNEEMEVKVKLKSVYE